MDQWQKLNNMTMFTKCFIEYIDAFNFVAKHHRQKFIDSKNFQIYIYSIDFLQLLL